MNESIPQRFQNYLMSNPALAPVAGKRIYSETAVPPNDYKLSDGPCICSFVRTSPPDGTSQLAYVTIQLCIFAETPEEAWQAARSVQLALEGKPAPYLRYITCTSSGQLLKSELNWAFVLQYYRIIVDI